jgi:hypothetical protein
VKLISSPNLRLYIIIFRSHCRTLSKGLWLLLLLFYCCHYTAKVIYYPTVDKAPL